ncbi:MAG: undecaprenyl/decaprenyl-phosphate alpha-N-acetylglucosaminyl 1-phosphate transferase [Frankiales bacterium]|nr:undecaprenyl/decaprenyl-phosphate alpha-N-acetylglucosaminyl 1-phosphate transferase [Frankiales bacterium]
MTALGWPAYVAAFLAPLVVAWLLTPVMLRLALRRRILDGPTEEARKAQQAAIPYLGGVAIVVAFSLLVFAAAALDRAVSVLVQLAVLLGVGLVLALMGLLDDLRGGLSARLRLLVEVGAGVAVYANGSGADLQGPRALDVVVTVVWVVGITNAFNLLDNMDGLSAGVASIAGLSFGLIAAVNGQFLVAALAAGVAGCAAGFLRHNFHPAKIYMGDAGSLFLGYLLAVVGLQLQLVDTPPVVALFVPMLVLGVPLFDTTLVTVQRLAHGRSPAQGGRDHASHRLVWVGVPVPVAVCLLYATGVALGWLAVLLARLDTVSGLLLVAFVLTVGTFLMGLLSAVPVYDNSKQRQVMLRVVRDHEPEEQAS